MYYHCDEETWKWTQEEMNKKVAESKVALGAMGYRFVKTFPGADGGKVSMSGIVQGITNSGMRKCSFTDGAKHVCSLSYMKLHCSKVYKPPKDTNNSDDSL